LEIKIPTLGACARKKGGDGEYEKERVTLW